MAKGPEPIANILAELMARRGFTRVQSGAALEAAWRQAAGELAAQFTRVAGIKRGKLEIVVANSILVQELTFQKTALVKALVQALPDQPIKDLKFRVGSIG
jgi:predicted nucleic acid-binding Zn ribbon protein